MKSSLYKILLASLVAVVAGLVAVGAGAALQIVFPLVALTIGIVTLQTSPHRDYIHFVMLLWMFAPLVRRLVDWQSGRTSLSLVLVTPLIVTLLSFLLAPQRWPKSQAPVINSFLLYVAAVFWGCLIGLITGKGFAAIYGLLTWLAPVGFALMIVSQREQAKQISDTLTRAAVAGGLAMGIYALIQFAIVPPWDRAWIMAADMGSLSAVPFGIKVFSTMNAPGVFAGAIMVCLLAIFNRPSPLYLVAGVPMALALALTLVRGAWAGLVLGLVILVLLGKAKVKARVLSIFGVLLLVTVPVLLQSAVFEEVGDRAGTLWSLEGDRSFEARSSLISEVLSDIPGLLLGHGLGATGVATGLSEDGEGITSFDNGILDILFTFGIAGFVILGVLVFWILRLVQAVRRQPTLAATAVIPIVVIAQLILANKLYSPNGMFLFPFLAAALASVPQRRTRPLGSGGGFADNEDAPATAELRS